MQRELVSDEPPPLHPPLGWPLQSLRGWPLWREYPQIKAMLAPLGRDGLNRKPQKAKP